MIGIDLTSDSRRVYLTALRNVKTDPEILIGLWDGSPSKFNTLVRKIKVARGGIVFLTPQELDILREATEMLNGDMGFYLETNLKPGSTLVQDSKGENWSMSSPKDLPVALRLMLKQQEQRD